MNRLFWGCFKYKTTQNTFNLRKENDSLGFKVFLKHNKKDNDEIIGMCAEYTERLKNTVHNVEKKSYMDM